MSNSTILNKISQSPRFSTVPVRVGSLIVGGGAPIVVQSMTNTDTSNIEETAKQCFDLWQAGSELVRITVNHKEAAKAVPYIRDKLVTLGWDEPLLVGDFHYIGHKLLKDFPDCAKALAKYRINPGNVGFGNKQDINFGTMIDVANQYNKPVRIGVNWGSLDQNLIVKLMDDNAKLSEPKTTKEVTEEALIFSALSSAESARGLGMAEDKIILSVKVSDVWTLVNIYQKLAYQTRYPLHLGLTEAGMGSKGVAATASAFTLLLTQGIGDTIRASLTPQPGGDRTLEVRVCQEILQTLGLRAFMPMVTACPGCGRTTSTVFQTLAQTIQDYVRAKMPLWRAQYPGVEDLKLAVMGCVVNGPGESKHSDIGISLPGTGEAPAAPVFVDGKKYKTLRGENIDQEFIKILEQYIDDKYTQSV